MQRDQQDAEYPVFEHVSDDGEVLLKFGAGASLRFDVAPELVSFYRQLARRFDPNRGWSRT